MRCWKLDAGSEKGALPFLLSCSLTFLLSHPLAFFTSAIAAMAAGHRRTKNAHEYALPSSVCRLPSSLLSRLLSLVGSWRLGALALRAFPVVRVMGGRWQPGGRLGGPVFAAKVAVGWFPGNCIAAVFFARRTPLA